jgi:putative membrane protein
MPRVVLPVVGLALTAALLSSVAHAHGFSDEPRGAQGSDTASLFAAGVPMLLAASLYLGGLLNVHGAAVRGRPAALGRAGAFFAGLAVLAAALWSPLDRWAAELFSAHMVQHELIMLAAAPLLVLGHPLPMFLWAFPASARQTTAKLVQGRAVRGVWAVLHGAGCAWLLHALALWVWHVPRFFDAALSSRVIHDVQHLTFLVTALLFWSALLDARRATQRGAGIVYLFTTTIHTGILGALITLASRPWYADFLQPATRWQLSALEDQQLGGLIMWVPGSVVYVGAALVLFARWIGLPPDSVSRRGYS